MADETKENAPADGGIGRPAQSTAAPAAAAAAAALPWYKRPLFWSIVLLALIGLILALLMHQKWLREQEIAAEQEKALQALKQKNDEQEAYLNQLRNLLQKDPCAIEPGLSGITPPEGSALPTLQDRSGTGSPSASGPAPAAPQEKAQGAESPVTPAPEQAKAPAEEKAGQSQAKPGSLAALMEQDTVLILALQDRGVSMGSGFFIAKDTILTNAHVVGAASQAVFINKKIGQVRNATVLLRTQEQGLDFAVLKTDPMDVTPLKISTQTVERTTKVSAWGYPGMVANSDPKFLKLLHGDASSAPEVVYTEGTVSVILDRRPPIIVHSATVSQGNSGGPLVNEKGTVVGINTMIQLDNQSYRQSSLAISSPTITAFLKANNVPFEADDSK